MPQSLEPSFPRSLVIDFTALSMPSQRSTLIAYHFREDNPEINPALGISSEFEGVTAPKPDLFPLSA
jgi:hypothetical protein